MGTISSDIKYGIDRGIAADIEFAREIAERRATDKDRLKRGGIRKAFLEKVIVELNDALYEGLEQATYALISEFIGMLGISEEHALEYGASFRIEKKTDSIMSIIFEPVSELILAMETGQPPYSIKEAMLRRGAQTTKDGKHRYRRVRIETREGRGQTYTGGIGKMPPTPGYETAIGKIDRIMAVLKDKYKLLETEETEAGYTRVEQFGKSRGRGRKAVPYFKRTREYESKRAFRGRKAPRMTTYSEYKTISDAPGSAEWIHPGFGAANIFAESVRKCQSLAAEAREYAKKALTETFGD